MDEVTRLTKEAFEPKLGRAMTDEEAAEYALHMRRFAAFLLDCARDEQLMERLGLKREGEGRVAPRAVDSTTFEGGNAVRTPLLVETDPPTGVPSRDALPHRDPSASLASASPAGQPAASQPIQRVTTGATVDGSL